jgi:hypothetical protein
MVRLKVQEAMYTVDIPSAKKDRLVHNICYFVFLSVNSVLHVCESVCKSPSDQGICVSETRRGYEHNVGINYF